MAIDEEGPRRRAGVRTGGGVAPGGLEPALGGADGILRLLVDEVEESRRGEFVGLVDRRRRRLRPRVGHHRWMRAGLWLGGSDARALSLSLSL